MRFEAPADEGDFPLLLLVDLFSTTCMHSAQKRLMRALETSVPFISSLVFVLGLLA